MDPAKKKFRVKKFRTVVKLKTVTGDTHCVEMIGLETAVKELAGLIALGSEAKESGLTLQGMAMAKKMAMKQIGILAREN